MLNSMLPFLQMHDNSFVRFLEEIGTVVNNKPKDGSNLANLTNQLANHSSTSKMFNFNLGESLISKKRVNLNINNAEGIKNNMTNKCEDDYSSFANYQEKSIIESDLNTKKVGKSSFFADNPLDLYNYYVTNTTADDEKAKIKEAANALNKIIEDIKIIPVIHLKNDKTLNSIDKVNSSNSIKTEEGNEQQEKKVKVKGSYVCEFCGQIFESASSKGGHMRSHHPGQSIKYKKKIEKANNRIYERELNKEAQKLWLLKLKNAGPNEKFYTKQVEIKRIKEELKHSGFMNSSSH